MSKEQKMQLYLRGFSFNNTINIYEKKIPNFCEHIIKLGKEYRWSRWNYHDTPYIIMSGPTGTYSTDNFNELMEFIKSC